MEPDNKNENRVVTCAILDANIWVREMLLNSAMGAAFLYRLESIGGRIGLPEAEKEVITRIVIEGQKAVSRIQKELSKVRSLIGESPDLNLPSDRDFEEAAKVRFSTLDDLIERVKISPDHYRTSLEKVIAAKAPNTTKEQYRDSLMWEAILDLSKTHEIVFITDDSDFYESQKSGKVLATDLQQECIPGSTVTLFNDLPSYLRSFMSEVVPNYENIAAILSNDIMNTLNDLADEKNFSIGPLVESNIEAFITEKRAVLALTFELHYTIFNVLEKQAIQNQKLVELEEPIPHREATLIASGNCFFDEKNEVVSEMRLADIDCLSLDGRPLIGLGVGFMFATIGGERTTPHRLERPITSL